MSFAPSASSAAAPAVPGKKMPEIITIPEQFYGVALKLKALTSAERDAAAQAPPPAPVPVPAKSALIRPPEAKRPPWAMIGVVVGVILLSIGGFVYFNRATLFRKPAPAVVLPVAVEPIPLAPGELTVLGGQGAASLAWTDAAANEQGYHIERRDAKDETAVFNRITTLPANSTAFIDVTVQPNLTYAYRVIAVGAGGESAPSNEAMATIPALPTPEAPKPTFPPGGLDTDSDGLTDVEETVYGTNAQRPDSDGDRFLDGNEVFHLYNPATAAPGKLLESGLVKSFTSPNGWVMYLPAPWTSSVDATDASKFNLETGRGERFVISVEANPSKQDLATWVAARINQPVDTLGEFTTKGGLRGVYGPDRMQAWLSWGDAVFHIVYDLRDQPFLNFRTTLEMMLNSLSLNGAAVIPTTLTPANSGPGSLLNLPTSSTEVLAPVAESTIQEAAATTTTSATDLPPNPFASETTPSSSTVLATSTPSQP
ncbi:fibronectin type III domain-containing protein [Patescibacteria group bacterium]|nr:fibronectin type III domain-containing protein [Patescibacteria group bacterium]